jgi:hypothetical protein
VRVVGCIWCTGLMIGRSFEDIGRWLRIPDIPPIQSVLRAGPSLVCGCVQQGMVDLEDFAQSSRSQIFVFEIWYACNGLSNVSLVQTFESVLIYCTGILVDPEDCWIFSGMLHIDHAQMICKGSLHHEVQWGWESSGGDARLAICMRGMLPLLVLACVSSVESLKRWKSPAEPFLSRLCKVTAGTPGVASFQANGRGRPCLDFLPVSFSNSRITSQRVGETGFCLFSLCG